MPDAEVFYDSDSEAFFDSDTEAFFDSEAAPVVVEVGTGGQHGLLFGVYR